MLFNNSVLSTTIADYTTCNYVVCTLDVDDRQAGRPATRYSDFMAGKTAVSARAYVGGNGLCISTCKKPSSSIGWSRSLAPVDEP